MIHPNSLKAYDELDLGKREAAVIAIYEQAHGPMTDKDVLRAFFGSPHGDMNLVRPRITALKNRHLLIEESFGVVCRWTGRTVRLVGLPEKQVKAFKPGLWREALTDKVKESEDKTGLRKRLRRIAGFIEKQVS
ncbi:MAG TPA: hypothetical protein ENI07_09935 [Desulfobacterales bacterium]|nr:hypothetical protein [Desulfobacterales bacterium]